MKSINIMPFNIQFNGQIFNGESSGFPHARGGSSYFQMCVRSFEDGDKRSAIFRGRRLNGQKVNLNQRGLSVIVASNHFTGVNSKISIDDEVPELTYWNYDEEVKPTDDIPQVINLAQFINIIHGETQ